MNVRHIAVLLLSGCGAKDLSDCAEGYARNGHDQCVVVTGEDSGGSSAEEEYEGDEAGECSDGADNDRDGLFDLLEIRRCNRSADDFISSKFTLPEDHSITNNENGTTIRALFRKRNHGLQMAPHSTV